MLFVESREGSVHDVEHGRVRRHSTLTFLCASNHNSVQIVPLIWSWVVKLDADPPRKGGSGHF